MVRDAERKLQPDQPRLLGVDNEMVVPVNKNVRVITTGAEVIHAFAVPSFGIKIDSIPGRINETWFRATREGIYYGQCSELCGKDHAFMPIAVRVVSEAGLQDLGRGSAEEIRARRRRAGHHGRSGGAIDGPLNGARHGAATTTAATTEVEGTDNGYDRTLPRRTRRPWRARPRARHTVMPTPPAGGAGSIRPTTRTSARCTWCSRCSAGWSAASCRSACGSS